MSDVELHEEQKQASRERLIFQVDEGHRSPQTAYKYRIDFGRFLDNSKK